jgi:hypothetical protein
LPSWKYVYVYNGQYTDVVAWVWWAYYYETNLTDQEVLDYFGQVVSQETYDQIISWERWFEFGK